MNRTEFAERLASGLAGWFQQIAAQDLAEQVGEDAARMELVRMISAQRAFIPDTAQRPTNWPLNTRKRIDIAVLGRRQAATGWYGAIELKWPGSSIDVAATRHAIVEDAVRVAFSTTSNMGANFVILGGTVEALSKLFDSPHPGSAEKEAQRVAFNRLFCRDPASPDGMLPNAELNTRFPDFGDRVPQTVFDGWHRRLKAELVTRVSASVGQRDRGFVYVWQCKK